MDEKKPTFSELKMRNEHFFKDLLINLLFTVFLYPFFLAVLFGIFPRLIPSFQTVGELTAFISVLAAGLLVFVAGAIALFIRRKYVYKKAADNSKAQAVKKAGAPRLPKPVRIAMIVLICIAVILIVILFIPAPYGLPSSANPVNNVITVAGVLGTAAFLALIIYLIFGVRTMCRHCKCFFVLKP